jgi:hypothetical protein
MTLKLMSVIVLLCVASVTIGAAAFIATEVALGARP